MIKMIQTRDCGATAVLEQDTHLSRWAEETGLLCSDPTVRERIVPLLRRGDVVVDVGANIGDHTIEYAKAVGDNGKVIAIEPNRTVFECLMRNMEQFKHVYVMNCALGSAEGKVRLRYSENVGATFTTKDISGASYNEVVECVTLDSLGIQSCRLLKIDVEGFEMEVLNGATRTIIECRPIVFIELNRGALERAGTSPENVVQFFTDIGYTMRTLDPTHTLAMPQVDVFFFPPSWPT